MAKQAIILILCLACSPIQCYVFPSHTYKFHLFYFYALLVHPTVEYSPVEMTVFEDENVTLSCVFWGSPRPTITWDREGASLPAMARTTTGYLESRNDTTGIYMVRISSYFCNIK